MPNILLLTLLGLLLNLPPALHAAQKPPAPSLLEIPFQVPLDDMLSQVEELVPQQTGHWRGWQRRHGVDTQYRAWRGRLGHELRGDTLTLYAHVRYWVRARKSLLGVGLSGDCGIDEPPRQAMIAVQMRFLWNPDWTLHPRFRILPTRFLDRCEMTIADIDVTPVVEQAFRDRMQQSLRQAMETMAPAMARVRSEAERVWKHLQQPLPLGERAWLSLEPLGMSLAPLQLANTHARFTLGVLLNPTSHLGRPPALTPRPLPALIPFRPAPEGLRFRINLALDYGLLGEALTQALQGRKLELQERRVEVVSASVTGKAQELNIKLQLGGEAEGTAEIWSALAFDPENGTLRFEELNFIFEPKDDDLYLTANLFHERIRQTLQALANEWLTDTTGQLNRRLREALEQIAPDGSRLSMEALRLTRLDLDFTDTGLALSGIARGSVGVKLGQSDR